MYKSLYEAFRPWYNGGDIFFYADPHFGDVNAQAWRNDNISDEEQIRRINKTVGKEGTIVILGDIGDPEWLARIRGTIVLVLGNHDKGASRYYDYVLPENVFEGPLFIGPKILLSHEPYLSPFYINLHGHTHGEIQLDGNGLNLCAEHIHYTPVSMKRIRACGALGSIPDIHQFNKDMRRLLTQSSEEEVESEQLTFEQIEGNIN